MRFDADQCALRSNMSAVRLPAGNSPYTVEVWIRTTVSLRGALWSWGSDATNKFNGIRVHQGRLWHFWFNNDLKTPERGMYIFDNLWHHVAAAFDGKTRTIVVDFEVVASDTPVGHNVDTTWNFCLGASFWGGERYYYRGLMAGLKIYDTWVSADDMYALASNPNTSSAPSPAPTAAPSLEPTFVPSSKPTMRATAAPTGMPTFPTYAPVAVPTLAPTLLPTTAPRSAETLEPSRAPSTSSPTRSPTPADVMQGRPRNATQFPSLAPTEALTQAPSTPSLSLSPTLAGLTLQPTPNPTRAPTELLGVTFGLTIQGLSFLHLAADEDLLADVKITTRTSISQVLNVAMQLITLALSEGSVAVQVTIVPPYGLSSARMGLLVADSSESLGTDLAQQVSKVRGIGAATQGPITVTNVTFAETVVLDPSLHATPAQMQQSRKASTMAPTMAPLDGHDFTILGFSSFFVMCASGTCFAACCCITCTIVWKVRRRSKIEPAEELIMRSNSSLSGAFHMAGQPMIHYCNQPGCCNLSKSGPDGYCTKGCRQAHESTMTVVAIEDNHEIKMSVADRHAAAWDGRYPVAWGEDELEELAFKDVFDLIQDFIPEKSCSRYILEDCSDAFEMRQSGSSSFFQRLVLEAKTFTDATLDCGTEPPGQNPSYLFAIVCFSMDLEPFGAEEHQNFFSVISRCLATRDNDLLEACKGYLYFLVSAMQDLPVMGLVTLWRGFPAEYRESIDRAYRLGAKADWPGITSVSEDEEVARAFAGDGGVLLKISTFSARSISAYAVYRDEMEAVLLPNFKAQVTKGLVDIGCGCFQVELREIVKDGDSEEDFLIGGEIEDD